MKLNLLLAGLLTSAAFAAAAMTTTASAVELHFVSGATGDDLAFYAEMFKKYTDKTGDTVTVVPMPSSTTEMKVRPPSFRETAMRWAPASIAFSTSSFTALAGRSTTSPAAIRSMSTGSRRRTGMGGLLFPFSQGEKVAAEPSDEG